MATSINHKIKYFAALIERYYLLPYAKEENFVYSDFVNVSYPLKDELLDETTSRTQKIEAVTHWLQQKATTFNLKEEEAFWSKMFSAMSADRFNWKNEKNGRVVVSALCYTMRCQNYVPAALPYLVNSLIERIVNKANSIKKIASWDTENSPLTNEITAEREAWLQAEKAKRDESWSQTEQWLEQFRKFVKLVKRFNNRGDLVETDNHDWRLIGYHCVDRTEWQAKISSNERQLLFGAELELDIGSRENYHALCEFLLKENFLEDKTFIMESDGSLSGNFPIEIISCPMTIEESTEKWRKVQNFIATLSNVRYGREVMGGGLHIHFSRKIFTNVQLKNITDAIYSHPEREKLIGKGSARFASWGDNLRAIFKNSFKLIEDYGDGTCKAEIDFTIETLSRSVAINFQKTDTVEVRAFNSQPDVASKIKILFDLINENKEKR